MTDLERQVFEGFETDTEFALNTISPTPLPLKDFEVEVVEAKLAYIKSQKGGSSRNHGYGTFGTDSRQAFSQLPVRPGHEARLQRRAVQRHARVGSG